jgi:Family of unknown function (DUF6328)
VAKLKDKVQNALDEGRMLLLGTQVLIGFGYRAFFEERFQALARWSQAALLAALALLLLAFVLLSLPASYHRLVAGGDDRPDVHEFTSGALRLALLPFALGLGLDVAVASGRAVSAAAALALGAGTAACALAAWYVYTFGARARHGRASEESDMEESELSDRIKHVLTEARMVLPGAQALLGFQFAVTLMRSFEELPRPLRLLHIAVLGAIALTVVLLMMPAAYHRIVERGEETEHFHRLASRFVIAAMVPLALGVCGDLLIVVYKVVESYRVAVAAAAVALATAFGLWFGLTLALRRRRERGGRRSGPRPDLRPAQART